MQARVIFLITLQCVAGAVFYAGGGHQRINALVGFISSENLLAFSSQAAIQLPRFRFCWLTNV